MNIETERLIMRQWQQSDYSIYAEYYADKQSAKFVGGAVDSRKAWRQMATLAGHWLLKGYGIWAVEEKSSGEFIGAVGLWEPEGWPEMELGYWLVNSAHGKGYATEASVRAREFAYSELAATTLVSYIDPENKSSISVAERLGAVRESIIDLVDCGPHCVYRHLSPDEILR